MIYEEGCALQKRRAQLRKETFEEAAAILALAGVPHDQAWELANRYWPDHPDYDDVRRPWWLFRTPLGLVRVGRRKSVIEIDWSATEHRFVVTGDEVTKEGAMVHAWSSEKAVVYLRSLREKVEAKK